MDIGNLYNHPEHVGIVSGWINIPYVKAVKLEEQYEDTSN